MKAKSLWESRPTFVSNKSYKLEDVKPLYAEDFPEVSFVDLCNQIIANYLQEVV